jgi:hypothetical protein
MYATSFLVLMHLLLLRALVDVTYICLKYQFTEPSADHACVDRAAWFGSIQHKDLRTKTVASLMSQQYSACFSVFSNMQNPGMQLAIKSLFPANAWFACMQVVLVLQS